MRSNLWQPWCIYSWILLNHAPASYHFEAHWHWWSYQRSLTQAIHRQSLLHSPLFRLMQRIRDHILKGNLTSAYHIWSIYLQVLHFSLIGSTRCIRKLQLEQWRLWQHQSMLTSLYLHSVITNHLVLVMWRISYCFGSQLQYAYQQSTNRWVSELWHDSFL